MKTCVRCGQGRPMSQFERRTETGKLRGTCKSCRRAGPGRCQTPENRRKSKLRSKYGLTVEQFGVMATAQDYCCAICRQIEDPLSIDHDHDSGAIRALLCGACNRGLGVFKDNPEYLRAAAEYLETYALAS